MNQSFNSSALIFAMALILGLGVVALAQSAAFADPGGPPQCSGEECED